MLPVAKYYYQEQISSRAIIGTVIALLGAAMIFLT
jgi:hypothetical protein